MFVSSAVNTNFTPRMFKDRLFVYSKNKGGPKIEPWVTPLTVLLSENVYFCCVKYLRSRWVIPTNYEQVDKYHLNHKFMSPLLYEVDL
jgi:hypothetical protein